MNILNQKKVATILSFVILSAFPFAVYGDTSLVPCTDDCDFDNLIKLLNNIIKFLLYDIAFPLVALGFMYAGARMILYQKKEAEWTKTKEMLEDIAIGFGYILGTYVLIKFVLSQFLDTNFTTFLFE